MAETVYTEALRQALEIVGSTQALASRLRVPETTLARWISGSAFMPYLAFLETLKYVSEQQQRLTQDGRCGESKFSLNIGTNFARCSACDGVEFRCVNSNEPRRYVSIVSCLTCGKETPYGQLVVALAKEASVAARARLVKLTRTQAELIANDPRKKK